MHSKDVTRSEIFFDPWLVCVHSEVEALVSLAVEDGLRRADVRRLRKRRDKDRQAFRSLAHALVANAAYALALGLEPPSVAISLANPTGPRSRYDGPSLGQLDAVIKAIAPALVTLTRSGRKGVASVLTAGAGLRRCVEGLTDFGVASFKRPDAETIILRRIERDYATGARDTFSIHYEDVPETRRFRAELERINSSLEAADLEFVGERRIDARQRRLRRIFNTPDNKPRFDLGGRLGGGWWENMRSEERYQIRIDGRPLVDLDFSAMFLRLAYVRAGQEPPQGDLYAGILGGTDDALHREGVKRAVNALLSRPTPLTRLPRGNKELLPKGSTGRSIRDAILERHAPIREQFEAGAGPILMRTESDILVASLLALLDLGIVALPMHDGLVVREDHGERALVVMRGVSKETTGFELPAKLTPLVGPLATHDAG